MNTLIFGAFISAAFTSLMLLPFLQKVAVRFGGMDAVEDRKVHQRNIPRLGGVAIFSGFLVPYLVFSDLDRQSWWLVVGGVIIFITGLADDFFNLRPRYKLCGEILAAFVGVVLGGLSLTSLGNPLGFGEIALGRLALPFTVFAVVGVINAINLIDGLDGLAGGVSSIACVALGVLALKTGNSALLLLIGALLGGLLGFLRSNTYPAKIFMGDSGSLFLGYCLAFFSIKLVTEGNGTIAPFVPLIILGVPLLDTLVVMINRFLKGEKIYLPDKTHVHHRLLAMGIDHKSCVFILYGISYLFCLLAVFLHDFPELQLLITFLWAAVTFYAAVNLFTKGAIRKSCSKAVSSIKSLWKLTPSTPQLILIIKCLLLTILILSISIPLTQKVDFGIFVSCLLFLIMGLLFSRDSWGRMLFQIIIYMSALCMVYMVEHYSAGVSILGLPLNQLWNTLFFLLFILVFLKITLRGYWQVLIDSPFEYFILFMVISIPLLPPELATKYHLLAVAAKSAILFAAYKLYIMNQLEPKRKIMFATGTALFAFSLILLI